jgi:hypothetical protein
MSPDDRVRQMLTQLIEKIDFSQQACMRMVREVGYYATADVSDKPVLALIAIDLDHYYTSVEMVFEAVARGLDDTTPSGPNWHLLLLEQMARPATTRAAVISGMTAAALKELLQFRHFLRHAYAVELRWDKFKHLVTQVPTMHNNLAKEFDAFVTFLTECLKQTSTT